VVRAGEFQEDLLHTPHKGLGLGQAVRDFQEGFNLGPRKGAEDAKKGRLFAGFAFFCG
jgi:hypothetical protein